MSSPVEFLGNPSQPVTQAPPPGTQSALDDAESWCRPNPSPTGGTPWKGPRTSTALGDNSTAADPAESPQALRLSGWCSPPFGATRESATQHATCERRVRKGLLSCSCANHAPLGSQVLR
jgi:hypothetical protein